MALIKRDIDLNFPDDDDAAQPVTKEEPPTEAEKEKDSIGYTRRRLKWVAKQKSKDKIEIVGVPLHSTGPGPSMQLTRENARMLRDALNNFLKNPPSERKQRPGRRRR